MATPVFKFRHPEFPDFDLYFIQNTFYELPESIPMDLTTFMIYHMKSKRTLSGFFLCWDNLEKRGSSMDDVNFESWFNEEEKMTLYQDAIYSRAIEKAIENSAYSQQIRNFITLNHATNAYRQVAGFLNEMGYPANSNFINISYYYSWKIQKFDLFKGFPDDYSKDYTAFLEEFLEATGYLKYRDLHPLLHEDINVEDKTHSGHAADSIEMVWEILKNDDDDKTWITAPWLLQ